MKKNLLYLIIFLLFSTVTHAIDREIASIIVLSASENSNGLKEKDLNHSVLSIWENWLVKTTTANAYRNFSEQGYDPSKLKLKIKKDSLFINVSGKKLAVIRLNLNSLVRHAIVMGIKGDELYRVTCIRPSNHTIPILYGKCGDEVGKIFGVKINY